MFGVGVAVEIWVEEGWRFKTNVLLCPAKCLALPFVSLPLSSKIFKYYRFASSALIFGAALLAGVLSICVTWVWL